MQFEEGNLYHAYNQGNNRKKIFFNRENYLCFLQKIKTYIILCTDILAWCLMLNHFHLMLKLNEVSLSIGIILSDANTKQRTLNDSIGIMLRSYASTINKQENRTGKLFREQTKAECINCHKGIIPSFYNMSTGTQINSSNPEKQYPQIYFNYIHKNPVKANLVKNSIDWEFSSAIDYAGLRNGTLVNKQLASNYIIF